MQVHKSKKYPSLATVTVGGINYYFNPKYMSIDSDVIRKLEKYPAKEGNYSISWDKNFGLMIY